MCRIRCINHGIYSKGILFQAGKEYKVSKEVFEYLLNVFPFNFEIVEDCRKKKIVKEKEVEAQSKKREKVEGIRLRKESNKE